MAHDVEEADLPARGVQLRGQRTQRRRVGPRSSGDRSITGMGLPSMRIKAVNNKLKHPSSPLDRERGAQGLESYDLVVPAIS